MIMETNMVKRYLRNKSIMRIKLLFLTILLVISGASFAQITEPILEFLDNPFTSKRTPHDITSIDIIYSDFNNDGHEDIVDSVN